MSPISSNTLFHFTNKMTNLISILKHGFWPHYSYEEFAFPLSSDIDGKYHAHPIVSFCDIPLSHAIEHMENYGNYGIGLTKEWGMKKGLTPVLYSYPSAYSAKGIAALFGYDPVAINDDENKTRDSYYYQAEILTALLKPYEGPFTRHGRTSKNDVKFYDEREWRYLPSEAVSGQICLLDKNEYEDKNKLKAANEKMKHLARLSFEPSDIRFIIVATESNIVPMIQEIKIMNSMYTPDDKDLLASRIISAEQIVGDF